MGINLLILGNTGTGKSSSIKNLNPENTFIIQCVNKELPFKGYIKKYPVINKENRDGNRTITNSYKDVFNAISYANKHSKFKTLIIDDVTYLMTHEYMTSEAKGFDKFNGIAENFYKLVNDKIKNLRDDLDIILMGHEEIDNNTGRSKMKTLGKLLDEKICVEGLFSIVLNTLVNNDGYFFQTQNTGYNTAKSPYGMFEPLEPNDLKEIINKINIYYETEEGDDENA